MTVQTVSVVMHQNHKRPTTIPNPNSFVDQFNVSFYKNCSKSRALNLLYIHEHSYSQNLQSQIVHAMTGNHDWRDTIHVQKRNREVRCAFQFSIIIANWMDKRRRLSMVLGWGLLRCGSPAFTKRGCLGGPRIRDLYV